MIEGENRVRIELNNGHVLQTRRATRATDSKLSRHIMRWDLNLLRAQIIKQLLEPNLFDRVLVDLSHLLTAHFAIRLTVSQEPLRSQHKLTAVLLKQ